jgi:hypothetical protein
VRNVEIWDCRLFSSTIRFGHTRHQRVLADNLSARLDQRHQHVESASAELDRPAVGKQLAAMWQHPETSESDARRCLEARFIDRIIERAASEISDFSRKNQRAAR